MARRNKRKAAKLDDEIGESDAGPSNSKSVSSSDDEEANEDLSLKIVEKSLLAREAKSNENDAAVIVDAQKKGVASVDFSSSGSLEGNVMSGSSGEAELKKKIEEVAIAKDEENIVKMEQVEMGRDIEAIESVEPNPVQISENAVLRKLLRGARYFDPPDSGWETCYNCGEEGHMAVNCTASKRKKPCFVCGSLEHTARQCLKSQDCYICKEGGHRAKDCPAKHKVVSKNLKICLRCGDSGHGMFSCKNEYYPEDLKRIQCYVCKSFGHLCCVSYADTIPKEVSCYRCGQLGHTGMACTKSVGETGKTTGTGSASSCYKCGEEGHFARECINSSKTGRLNRETGESFGSESHSTCYRCGEGGHFARECTNIVKVSSNSHGETRETFSNGSSSTCYRCGEGGHFARECTITTKVRRRDHLLSTPVKGNRKENRDSLAWRSAPHDHGKGFKRAKVEHEEKGFTTPRKSKHRGGWITEDPGDFSDRKPKRKNHRRSPSTPSNEGHMISAVTAGGHISNSRSSQRKTSHRYSASRFGNGTYSNDERRRNRDWW